MNPVFTLALALVSDPAFSNAIAIYKKAWQAGHLRDAELAALYFLQWQGALHGKAFASRRYKQDPRADFASWQQQCNSAQATALSALLITYLSRYQFRGVIPNVSHALVAWLNNQWSLCLCDYIPDPRAVLAMQTRGIRPVTILTESPRMLQPVLEKPNAFVFMQHDLEHAWQLFHDPQLQEVQVRFAQLVQHALQQGLFDRYLHDALFSDQFDYLISDMNTHPLHALYYLNATVTEYYLRDEGKASHAQLSNAARQAVYTLLQQLAHCWEFSAEASAALLAVTQGKLPTSLATCLFAAFSADQKKQDQHRLVADSATSNITATIV